MSRGRLSRLSGNSSHTHCRVAMVPPESLLLAREFGSYRLVSDLKSNILIHIFGT